MDASFDSTELKVLYFQQECLVLSKMGGILTQAPPGIESVESMVRRHFRNQNNVPLEEAVYVGMPHRLDRPASGAMLFAESKKVARKLSLQFEKRTVKKTYWAIVAGIDFESEGTWKDWMRKVPDKPESEICQENDSGAQLAELSYQVIVRDANYSLLQIKLETGRTHQIRLQTSSRGLPILGDAQYGSNVPFGPQTLDQRRRWIALHSRSIDFWHPKLHHPVLVTADVPECWLEFDCDLNLSHCCATYRHELS